MKADEALESFKKKLSKAPILAAPKQKEPMLLHISANNQAVSAAVVVERKEEGKEYPIQSLVYYVSEVLTASKQRYPHGESKTEALFSKAPHHSSQLSTTL